MNANTNKIESSEVTAAGVEIIKLSADEQKVAYGFCSACWPVIAP